MDQSDMDQSDMDQSDTDESDTDESETDFDLHYDPDSDNYVDVNDLFATYDDYFFDEMGDDMGGDDMDDSSDMEIEVVPSENEQPDF